MVVYILLYTEYKAFILLLCVCSLCLGASGLHLTKHENFHGGLDAISVGDGLFTILTTLSKRATSVQVMLQPILTYMACGYMGRQVRLITEEVRDHSDRVIC